MLIQLTAQETEITFREEESGGERKLKNLGKYLEMENKKYCP
jgi:hypothetical protein